VGSSMGAWLATLLACQRADRVHGILGVAAAPDFTELLLLPMLSDTQKNALKRGDTVELQNDYEDIEPHRIRQALIDSGRRCRVLDAALSIQCPVRLIHGTGDKDVPWQLSERLLQAITGNDAQLCLVKGADHRFSEPAQLEQITRTLDELLHN